MYPPPPDAAMRAIGDSVAGSMALAYGGVFIVVLVLHAVLGLGWGVVVLGTLLGGSALYMALLFTGTGPVAVAVSAPPSLGDVTAADHYETSPPSTTGEPGCEPGAADVDCDDTH